MKVLMIGDVVASPGHCSARAHTGSARAVCNRSSPDECENVAAGFSIPVVAEQLSPPHRRKTSGNHIFDKRKRLNTSASSPVCLRPANYPPGRPGVGSGGRACRYKGSGNQLMGVWFYATSDDPFRIVEGLVNSLSQKLRCAGGHACGGDFRKGRDGMVSGRPRFDRRRDRTRKCQPQTRESFPRTAYLTTLV